MCRRRRMQMSGKNKKRRIKNDIEQTHAYAAAARPTFTYIL